MKIIHLTDTHITQSGQALYGKEAIDTMRAAISDINTHHSDASFCVITGDLTHYGDEISFERLREVLQDFSIPYHLVLGNHDHRDYAATYFPDHMKRDEHGFLQQMIDTPQGKFLLLDTVRPETHVGEYCTKRQQWLRDKLEQYEEDSIYLCMHHAPFKTGLKAMDTIGMNDEDAKAFRDIVQAAPNISHIFLGHYHRPMSGHWQGIPFSCIRSMMLQVTLDLETPDMVIGKHEQPQYAVVLIDDEQTVVHYHDFADESEVFTMGKPKEIES